MFETTHQKAWRKLARHLSVAFRVALVLVALAVIVALEGGVIYGVVWLARLAWK